MKPEHPDTDHLDTQQESGGENPSTGTTEEGAGEQSAPAAGAGTDTDVSAPTEPTVEQQLAERTLDLQRTQAEYVNYKRRVDRDRELVRAQGEIAVLQSLLTVLDDIGRADEHGQLEGGFKAVADALHSAVTKHQLEAYGAKGEPFDPTFHEAVFHAGESGDVDVPSIHQVIRTGYRVGDRVLRAATVGVVDPGESSPSTGVGVDTDTDTDTATTDTDR